MHNCLLFWVWRILLDPYSRSFNRGPFGTTISRNLGRALLIGIAILPYSFAQSPFTTSRGDNARDGANTSETLLAPGNVNSNSFGHLFSVPVDYVVMAQP